MSTPNQLEDAILHKLVHTQFFLELDFFQPKVKFWKDRSKARLEEHDKLIVRLSRLLGSAGGHKRVDLVEVILHPSNFPYGPMSPN